MASVLFAGIAVKYLFYAVIGTLEETEALLDSRVHADSAVIKERDASNDLNALQVLQVASPVMMCY